MKWKLEHPDGSSIQFRLTDKVDMNLKPIVEIRTSLWESIKTTPFARLVERSRVETIESARQTWFRFVDNGYGVET